WSPVIRGTKFKTIATVAETDYGSDIRLTVQLREQLIDGGWHAVARAGRWDSESDAVSEICAPGADPVDGVLFVTYDHLALYDCATRSRAYDIRSSPQAGGLSLPKITGRLMRYLRGKKGKPLPAF